MPGRRQHFLLDEGAIGLTAEFLDDATENAISEIRIGVRTPRIEIKRLAHRIVNDLFRGNRQRRIQGLGSHANGAITHGIARFVAVPAARVLQTLANRYFHEPWVEVLCPAPDEVDSRAAQIPWHRD